ncbi:MAG: OmpA family protein [Acidobacteriota bacterium]
MLRRKALLLTAFVLMIGSYLGTRSLRAQGIDTPTARTEWEEINFDYDSAVLVDGFPSLLRMGELLQQNADYKIRVEGYTDGLGNEAYNTALGLRRANAVRDFLLKYGARPAQIVTATRGMAAPRVAAQGKTYQKTDEARFMNRRVVLTITDGQGRTIGAGSANDVLAAAAAQRPGNGGAAGQGPDNAALMAAVQKNADCCDQVLKRLDKLDDIAKLLKDLADQNAALQREVAGLKQNQQAIESRLNQPAPPPPAPVKVPTANEVATAVRQDLAQDRRPILQVMNANVGSDGNRNLSFTGKGRFFGPLGDRFGIQAGAEYYYIRGQREGQFDIGLVDRLTPHIQAGLFGSFKTVSLSGMQSSGTLGQGSFVVDYIFGRGRVGLFGSKGFLDNSIVSRANAIGIDGSILQNTIVQKSLRVVDQIGLSSTVALMGNLYAEGNIGYLHSVVSGDRMGGTIRLIYPLNDKIALTAEGGVNETMVPTSGGPQGRAVIGVQFGNFIRPKSMLANNGAIPMDIPRVRYEVQTTRIRVGNSPPVADAGPDLSGVSAGTVALDGSGSYDPDNDPITYQWIQEAGPTVSVANATTAHASFNATLGQLYVFRLVVKDTQGGTGTARVRIATQSATKPAVVSFNANPAQIQSGGATTLTWATLNADTVNISGLGNVPVNGTASVSPTTTTTYTLTARNNVDQIVATTTVTVAGSAFQYCFASPSNITQGQTSNLTWATSGATGISISPTIGAVGASGTFAVSPLTNTTYTLTSTGPGTAASCSITVNVTAANLPTITRFSASPNTIDSGGTSTLLWAVQNATSVSISTLGTVQPTGTQDVSPAATTTYILTATNLTGSVTSQAVVNVNVIPLPTITSFVANPTASPAPLSPVLLTCTTTGASNISINGFTYSGPIATTTVNPDRDFTYTCVATNSRGQSVSQSLLVKVTAAPVVTATPPTIVIAGGTGLRTTTFFVPLTIDASGSFSSTGATPLTYTWTVPDAAGNSIITGQGTSTVTIQFLVDSPNQSVELRVTDSKGNSSTVNIPVRVQQIGLPLP